MFLGIKVYAGCQAFSSSSKSSRICLLPLSECLLCSPAAISGDVSLYAFMNMIDECLILDNISFQVICIV